MSVCVSVCVSVQFVKFICLKFTKPIRAQFETNWPIRGQYYHPFAVTKNLLRNACYYIYFVSYLSGKPGSWLPSGLMWVVVFPPMRYVPWSESGVHEKCPFLPTSRVRCSSQVPVSGLHCRQLCFSVLLGPAPAISNPVKKWIKVLRNIWKKKFELIDTTSTEQMVV